MDNKSIKNIYFEKPIIASYTEIAALLCVVQDKSSDCILWKYILYGNLCWDNKTNILYFCGKYNHYTYKEFEEEDRICLCKLPKKTSCDELKIWIDRGYYVIAPINTQLLEITEYPYRHNVFITGYEDDEFIVYDFWSPGFQWKFKRIDGKKLFQSIDFSNIDTVQAFYVFKENEAVCSNNGCRNSKELYKLLSTNLERRENECYDNERFTYGLAAYSSLCDYLALLNKFSLTDCQNFHVLYDHLNFTHQCFETLFGDLDCVQSVIDIYTDLVSQVNKLRTIAYKQYIAKKDIGNQRDMVLRQICTIAKNEKRAIEHLIKGTNF